MLNKVQVIGNLGKDPEVRFTPSGKAVCRMSVAANEKWTTADGEKQEHVEWFNVVVWGKAAEACGQYLQKGRQVYVEGRLRTRKYDDKDGTTRWITEVIADRVQFLSGPREEGRPTASTTDNDDIPF